MNKAEAGTRVAIVTGASSGIGAAVAVELSKKGYAVVLAARRVERLSEVAAKCREASAAAVARFSSEMHAPEPLVVPTDVARQEQVDALVKAAVDRYGRLDVMVNNAGYGIFARVHETTTAQMRDIFDVNFMGVFYGCQAAAKVMTRQGSGHIFNVSSVIGKRGTPFHGAYCATKFAIAGLTDSLRVEMRPYGVRVTLVCPALTATEFFDHSRGGSTAQSSFVSLKGMTRPEKIAKKVVATIGKRRPELVFTSGGKLLVFISAVSPRLADAMMRVYHNDLARSLNDEEGREKHG